MTSSAKLIFKNLKINEIAKLYRALHCGYDISFLHDSSITLGATDF